VRALSKGASNTVREQTVNKIMGGAADTLIQQQQSYGRAVSKVNSLCDKGVMIGLITQSAAGANDHTICLAFLHVYNIERACAH
jgi:hypothetical protein